MAWTNTKWACGHSGSMQLYGKISGRSSRVAYQAGRQCMACWLVEQWEKARDPRAAGEDRYRLAAAIAENKGIRIDVPDNVPVGKNDNPLTNYSTDELREEIERRLGEKHNDK